MKFKISWKGYGKYKYPTVKSVSEKKARELVNSGEDVFDSRKDALSHAIDLKKGG